VKKNMTGITAATNRKSLVIEQWGCGPLMSDYGEGSIEWKQSMSFLGSPVHGYSEMPVQSFPRNSRVNKVQY
jgi:hypothetical protein